MLMTPTIASILNLMGPDMMVILLIVLLLFGAKKLPEFRLCYSERVGLT